MGSYETARFDLQNPALFEYPRTTMSVPSSGPRFILTTRNTDAMYRSTTPFPTVANSVVMPATREANLPPLARLAPLPEGAKKPHKLAARWGRQKFRDPKRKLLWKDTDRLPATQLLPSLRMRSSQPGTATRIHPDTSSFLTAIDRETGDQIWKTKLGALVVKGGIAVGGDASVVVSLEDGQVICFSGRD